MTKHTISARYRCVTCDTEIADAVAYDRLRDLSAELLAALQAMVGGTSPEEATHDPVLRAAYDAIARAEGEGR